jgi:Aspartyl protease
VPRPALPIELVRLDGKVLNPIRAIVDSGADATTLPIEWARQLGIDVDRDCVREPCGTAGGETTGFVYLGSVKAIVLGEHITLTVTFNEGLDVALLGRRDFFFWYKVEFDQRAKSFTLERYVEPGAG